MIPYPYPKIDHWYCADESCPGCAGHRAAALAAAAHPVVALMAQAFTEAAPPDPPVTCCMWGVPGCRCWAGEPPVHLDPGDIPTAPPDEDPGDQQGGQR